MIQIEKLKQVVEDYLGETGFFPVEVKVRTGNRLQVFIDGPGGVNIDLCAGLTRFIESQFDRSLEDYDLEVSSAGLDMPLRDPRQFAGNRAKAVEVVFPDGTKKKGHLGESDLEGFELHTENLINMKDPETGKRVKKKESLVHRLAYADVKTVKLVISFTFDEKTD